MNVKTLITTLLPVLCLHHILWGQVPDLAQLERISKSGQTLSLEVTARFSLKEQRIKNDTGINVLIDLSHQANFFMMWTFPKMLRERGFRVSGSQATLNTVLTPGQQSRVRIPVGKRRPFAWWLNPWYNVAITFQVNPQAQIYLPEEIEALKKFVHAGGGLVLVGSYVSDIEKIEKWPLNGLARQFDASFSSEADSLQETKMPVSDLGPNWQVYAKGANGKPVIARREYGEGRILIIGSFRYLQAINDSSSSASELENSKAPSLAEMVKWAAAGSQPILL